MTKHLQFPFSILLSIVTIAACASLHAENTVGYGGGVVQLTDGKFILITQEGRKKHDRNNRGTGYITLAKGDVNTYVVIEKKPFSKYFAQQLCHETGMRMINGQEYAVIYEGSGAMGEGDFSLFKIANDHLTYVIPAWGWSVNGGLLVQPDGVVEAMPFWWAPNVVVFARIISGHMRMEDARAVPYYTDLYKRAKLPEFSISALENAGTNNTDLWLMALLVSKNKVANEIVQKNQSLHFDDHLVALANVFLGDLNSALLAEFGPNVPSDLKKLAGDTGNQSQLEHLSEFFVLAGDLKTAEMLCRDANYTIRADQIKGEIKRRAEEGYDGGF